MNEKKTAKAIETGEGKAPDGSGSALELRAAAIKEEEARLKGVYAGFELKNEMKDPLFAKLMRAGIDMRSAYEFAHRDELTGKLINEVAQGVRERVLRDIETRGSRPAENGTGGRAAATIREKTPSEWSREERERIGREALKGKKHSINI